MWTVTPSPIGDLRIVARGGAITAIEFSPFRTPVTGEPLGVRNDDDPLNVLHDGDLPVAPDPEFAAHAWIEIEGDRRRTSERVHEPHASGSGRDPLGPG